MGKPSAVTPWLVDAILSDFNKNVDFKQRFDGLYNLWRRVLQINEDKSFTIYWEVIGVYETPEEAKKAKEDYRKSVQK